MSGSTSFATGGGGLKNTWTYQYVWSKKGLTITTSVSGRKLQNGVCENRRQLWWAAGIGAELSGCLSAPSWRAGLGDLLPFQPSSDIVYSVVSPPRAPGEVPPGKDQKYVV